MGYSWRHPYLTRASECCDRFGEWKIPEWAEFVSDWWACEWNYTLFVSHLTHWLRSLTNCCRTSNTSFLFPILRYDLGSMADEQCLRQCWFHTWVHLIAGYGNISCRTFHGRLATCAYALFGVPLMLVVLNSMGRGLFMSVQAFWEFMRRFVVFVRKLGSIHARMNW